MFVVLRRVPWGTSRVDRMDGGAAGGDDEDVGDLCPWEMPHELFVLITTTACSP